MRIVQPKEFKVVSLRECPTPQDQQLCDRSDKAAAMRETPGLPPSPIGGD